MDLKTYLSSLGRGGHKEFAKLLNISKSYLSQLANGRASLSPTRCVEIEKKSNGLVTRKELKKDEWQDIWPELVEQSNE